LIGNKNLKIPQQGALNTAEHFAALSSGSLQNACVMQGNNRIGLCDTSHLGRLCGPELRNGTGFSSGAWFGTRRNNARAFCVLVKTVCEEKRAATVEVFVWFAVNRHEAAAAASCTRGCCTADLRRRGFCQGWAFFAYAMCFEGVRFANI
jgi:hypothetical protein